MLLSGLPYSKRLFQLWRSESRRWVSFMGTDKLHSWFGSWNLEGDIALFGYPLERAICIPFDRWGDANNELVYLTNCHHLTWIHRREWASECKCGKINPSNAIISRHFEHLEPSSYVFSVYTSTRKRSQPNRNAFFLVSPSSFWVAVLYHKPPNNLTSST